MQSEVTKAAMAHTEVDKMLAHLRTMQLPNWQEVDGEIEIMNDAKLQAINGLELLRSAVEQTPAWKFLQRRAHTLHTGMSATERKDEQKARRMPMADA